MTDSFAEIYKKTKSRSDIFTPPEEISKRFSIIERLAENDHGETYLLTDNSGSSRFVLKCYKKSKAASETREAEILRELQHKGLPVFVTEIEDGDMLYVLREYADGIQLSQYMDEHGGIGNNQAISIALQLCDILTYLHSQSPPVIHRDVKPSNIIINPKDNSVKLIDFGISRRFSKDSDTDTEYYGTKKFSPPEQYGFSQTDSRTDIYALGIVLRYMLTGELDGKPDDKGLSKIVNKCTAFSPGDRYKSAAALKKDLIRHRNNTRSRAVKTIAAALVLCLALAAGFCVGRYTDIFYGEEKVSPASGDEIVVFVEPLIEEAVRLMLGREDAEPVMHGELKDITALYIHGKRVFRTIEECVDWYSGSEGYGTVNSLEDLRFMANLREICLQGQPVTDLTPLAGCRLLESIYFINSPVSDAGIAPLASLPRLHKLNLQLCDIRDVSSLNSLTALVHLDIEGAYIDSIAELELYRLNLLRISGTQVSSLDGIEKFTVLWELDIDRTMITDFSPLDNMPHFGKLIISSDMEKYLTTITRDDIEVNIW